MSYRIRKAENFQTHASKTSLYYFCDIGVKTIINGEQLIHRMALVSVVRPLLHWTFPSCCYMARITSKISHHKEFLDQFHALYTYWVEYQICANAVPQKIHPVSLRGIWIYYLREFAAESFSSSFFTAFRLRCAAIGVRSFFKYCTGWSKVNAKSEEIAGPFLPLLIYFNRMFYFTVS